MKTALYIEDGLTQVVLTPETDFESDALAHLVPKSIVEGLRQPLLADVRRASFYECRGGWHRFAETGDNSLIVRLRPEVTPQRDE